MKNKTIEIANTINEMITKFGSNLKITSYDVDVESFETENFESFIFNDAEMAVTSTLIRTEVNEEVFDSGVADTIISSNLDSKEYRVSLIKKDEKPHLIFSLDRCTKNVLCDIKDDNTIVVREVFEMGYVVTFTEIKFSA